MIMLFHDGYDIVDRLVCLAYRDTRFSSGKKLSLNVPAHTLNFLLVSECVLWASIGINIAPVLAVMLNNVAIKMIRKRGLRESSSHLST